MPDLKAFEKYVFETVKHHPEIRFWEVWNEPEVAMFWRGSPEEFGEMCQVATKAAHAADPTVKVFVGGYTGSGFAWHETSARAGALRGADGVSFHGYYDCKATPESLETELTRKVAHFRSLPVLSKETKPFLLWDTEGGSSDTTFLRGYEHPTLAPPERRDPLTWRTAAITAVQSAAILRDLGVERSFSYLWGSSALTDYDSLSALDMTSAPKPKVVARAVLQTLTDDARPAGNLKRAEGRLNAYLYESKGQTTILWWTGRGGRVEANDLKSLRPVATYDIMGLAQSKPLSATISELPSYLRCDLPATKVMTALKALSLRVETAPEVINTAAVRTGPDIPVLPDFAALDATFTPIDLRSYANMGLVDVKAGDSVGGWTDEGPFNDARNLKTGLQKFYGVPFDVIEPAKNDGKSVIVLRGTRVSPRLPLKIEGIDLGQRKANALYFLHGAGWGTPGLIGHYLVKYADGATIELPIKIPINSGNWWASYQPGEAGRLMAFPAANSDGAQAWRYLRIWEWKNPRPEVALQSLDFVSSAGDQTPILVGLTAK